MVPAICTFLGAIFSCTNYFRVIFTGGVGKNGSTIAVSSLLSPHHTILSRITRHHQITARWLLKTKRSHKGAVFVTEFMQQITKITLHPKKRSFLFRMNDNVGTCCDNGGKHYVL